MKYSMNAVYDAVGISKQAVFQYRNRQIIFDQKIGQLIVQADALRRAHPGCGVEKIYYSLNPDFIGRDRFIELFMKLGYRIKRKKNYRRTTYSSSMYYPNLIKGLTINKPSAIWQSDITYYRIGDRFYYLIFILDVYTRQIVGYNVSDNMRGECNVVALRSALRRHKAPDIHHSDRGSQYVYNRYTEILKRNNSQISMGLIAQENAYAERINRTIKEEYLDYWKPKNFKELKRLVTKAVKQYNSQRLHKNLKRQSPENFEKASSLLGSQQRTSLTIFNET